MEVLPQFLHQYADVLEADPTEGMANPNAEFMRFLELKTILTELTAQAREELFRSLCKPDSVKVEEPIDAASEEEEEGLENGQEEGNEEAEGEQEAVGVAHEHEHEQEQENEGEGESSAGAGPRRRGRGAPKKGPLSGKTARTESGSDCAADGLPQKRRRLTQNGAQEGEQDDIDAAAATNGEVDTVDDASASGSGMWQRHVADRVDLQQRIFQLQNLLQHTQTVWLAKVRLAKNRKDIPRVLRLCERYMLDPTESRVFCVLAVLQGSQDSFILNSIVTDDWYRRLITICRLTLASESHIEAFTDEQRTHVKEGVVLVEEDHGSTVNLRLARSAVLLTYGRPCTRDDIIRASATALEHVLQEEATEGSSGGGAVAGGADAEGGGTPLTPGTARAAAMVAAAANMAASNGAGIGGATVNELLEELRRPQPKQKQQQLEQNKVSFSSASPAASSSTPGGRGASASRKKGIPRSPQHGPSSAPTATTAAAAVAAVTITADGDANGSRTSSGLLAKPRSESIVSEMEMAAPATTVTGGANGGDDRAEADKESVEPYSEHNQLDYLEDRFQLVGLLVRSAAARLKDDMKKSGVAGNHMHEMNDTRMSSRALRAKVRVEHARIQQRLTATEAAGWPLPRLESLAQRLALDEFDKNVCVLLIGKTISPSLKTLIDTLEAPGMGRIVDDMITVGQALAILCESFAEQVQNRVRFYRSGNLIKNAIVSLTRSRWHHAPSDLTDQRIVLDRRMLDWLVGLDSEINELVEGSELYAPVVDLSAVVLPPDVKASLLQQCKAYDDFVKFRKRSGLQQVLPYGAGLVILLCGKSGTGKTMTVNALAKELGKRVLLVDFPSLTGKKSDASMHGDVDADLRGLFREADLHNSVLFFDECENIFRSREIGSDRTLNALLSEIERHEGIVFLTTNRPFDIDAAMSRRITTVVEFRPPDHLMRRRIWETLLQRTTRTVSEAAAPAPVAPAKIMQLATSSSSSSSSSSLSSSSSSSSSPSSSAAQATKSEDNDSSDTPPVLSLADDVDLAAIAVKYELTGGFIKNAVLSALLLAISRDAHRPVLRHDDLVQGCRLQMRGAMEKHGYQEQQVPAHGLDTLALSKEMRRQLQEVIDYEKGRAIVYGSWAASAASATSSDAEAATLDSLHSSSAAAASVFATTNQRACLFMLYGPAGAGKRTIARAVGYELGRNLKLLHVGQLFTTSASDDNLLDRVKATVRDARLVDAMLLLDGAEHMFLSEQTGGPGVAPMQALITRMLDIFKSFPGPIAMVCHAEEGLTADAVLQRSLLRQLYAVIRVPMPAPRLRATLWKALLPPRAPLGEDIDFNALANRFELLPTSISAAAVRAAAAAAMKPTSTIGMAELMAAAQEEQRKCSTTLEDMARSLFV